MAFADCLGISNIGGVHENYNHHELFQFKLSIFPANFIIDLYMQEHTRKIHFKY